MVVHTRSASERMFRGFVFALPVVLVVIGIAVLLLVFRSEAGAAATSDAAPSVETTLVPR